MRRHLSKLGRKGGLKGGKARMAMLTPKQRKELATKAARARWGKKAAPASTKVRREKEGQKGGLSPSQQAEAFERMQAAKEARARKASRASLKARREKAAARKAQAAVKGEKERPTTWR